jgi:hypothetical protein
MMSKWMSVGGIALCAVGCASYPAPTARMAQSMSSVTVAQEQGAAANPQANDYLTRANEELANAKKLVDDGNNERADYMLMRADADAKLAIEIAKAQKAEVGAQSAQAQAKTLQQAH